MLIVARRFIAWPAVVSFAPSGRLSPYEITDIRCSGTPPIK
jgi:hypothetical protein